VDPLAKITLTSIKKTIYIYTQVSTSKFT